MREERTALTVVVVALALAVVLGLAAALRPAPSPGSGPAITAALTAAPTPTGSTEAAVFEQPLSAGCATAESVWVLSAGGGIGRFDGSSWALVDPTLRSVLAAACGRAHVIAVGEAGTLVAISESPRAIGADQLGAADLHGISLTAEGALVVGSGGLSLRQVPAGWIELAGEVEADLHGVAAFGPASAWAVGAGGAAYRLEPDGWRRTSTGVDATLRAVAGPSADRPIAAGDAGTLLGYDGGWRRLRSGVEATLRAAVHAGGMTWIVGDRGTVLAVRDGEVAAVDLGTTCTLRAVFTRGDEVWFIGSDGTRGAVWRRAGGTVDRWGHC